MESKTFGSKPFKRIMKNVKFLLLILLLPYSINSFAQNKLTSDFFVGQWKICTDEGYSVRADSSYNCPPGKYYQFDTNGTYRVVQKIAAVGEKGTWRFANDTLFLDEKPDVKPTRIYPMKVLRTNMLCSRGFGYRHFRNGNKKSFTILTYFIKND
jgi:hypothetical protein